MILIDADSIIFGAFTAEKPVEAFNNKINSIVMSLRDYNNSIDHNIFLGKPGQENFRKHIFPTYKVKRPPRKKGLEDFRDEMIVAHNAIIPVDGLESDDMIAMAATQDKTAIIASIDKDFYQLENKIYDFTKGILIDSLFPNRFLVMQVVWGDTADGIAKLPNGGYQKSCGLPLTNDLGELFDYVLKYICDDKQLIRDSMVQLRLCRDLGDYEELKQLAEEALNEQMF